jgi:hypothetical protein
MLHSDLLAQQIATATRASPKVYHPIGALDAQRLVQALNDDAVGLAQAATVSMFEGVQGIVDQRFTWATVKLYYSCFYAARARLMLQGSSIFYIGSSPHLLEAKAGAAVRKQAGNSHSVVIAEFARSLPSDVVLSQDIASQPPMKWLEDKRNVASYRVAPFQDPEIPLDFKRFHGAPRRHLSAYLGKDRLLYAFDPEHALLALPLLMLLGLSDDMRSRGLEGCKIRTHYIRILASAKCFVPEFEANLSAFIFSK